jgi:trk system potassium uptake protein
MQKYAVIGLGNFGFNIAKSLKEYGSEVTGIDCDKEKILKARDYLNHAVSGDATDPSFLQTLAIKDLDGVVVSLGSDIGASVLITLTLKEMGVKRIIACAVSESHCMALEKLGVSDVVLPKRDIAQRLGKKLAIRNVLDYIPLAGEYVVMNITPPKSFVGKAIRDLQIGARFQCQILGIKYLKGHSGWNADAPEWENTKIAPTANDVIPENSVLIFLGKKSDLLRIQAMD